MDIPRPLFTTLQRYIDFDAAERSAVLAVPVHHSEVRADQEILREGERPTRCVQSEKV